MPDVASPRPRGRRSRTCPIYYLGVALARLGDCGAALRALEASLRQGAIQQTTEFTQLDAIRGPCATAGMHARPPTAGEREPDRAAAAPPPPIDSRRAEADIAAAVEAARRVGESRPSVLNDPGFERDRRRAESLLEEARQSLADAVASRDAAAYQQAETLAATARARFEQLLRQAEAIAAQSPAAGRPGTGAGIPAGSASPGAQAAPPPPPPSPTGGAPGGAPPTGGSATGAPPGSGTPAGGNASDSSRALPFALLGTGVLLMGAMLVIAVIVPQPTPFQYVVFRTTLSLAATCVAASIPWLTSVAPGFERAGSAGGAIGIFLLVYFVDPMKRLARPGTAVAVTTGAAPLRTAASSSATAAPTPRTLSGGCTARS